MANNRFPSEYRKDLFGKFAVFTNEDGDIEVANLDKEILMQSRETGVYQKVNLNDFVDMIKTVFPDRKEQKELLCAMFNNAED